MTDFQVKFDELKNAANTNRKFGLTSLRLVQTITTSQAVLAHLRDSGIPVEGKEAEGIVLKSIDPKQIMLSYESEGGTGPRAVAGIVAEIEDELSMSATCVGACSLPISFFFSFLIFACISPIMNHKAHHRS